MTYSFYIITCLALIVFQTVIMPDLPVISSFYDLTTIFVIYLAVLRSNRESLPVVLVLGVIMDNLSGTPLLVYTMTYFWLYISVRWLSRFLQVGMRFRLAFIVVVGVILETMISVVSFGGLKALSEMPASDIGKIAIRLLWALFIGPILILVLQRLHRLWNKMISRMLTQRSETADVHSAR
jgi:cell shape-determining protein MreD